jgi:HEAT repeat protein
VLDPETTAALIAALRDETAEVAMEAADALRRHPAELAVPALRNALENREGYFSAATRAAAVRALGVLLPVGEGATIAGAVRDGDLSVSLAGIAALAERAEAGSAEALLKLLEDRSGFYLPLTRHAAARGLSQLAFGDADRVRALLNTEADSTVRDALVGWPAV